MTEFIRIIFTSKQEYSNINNNELFKWIGFKYLKELPAIWGGCISMDAKLTGTMEPSWQFLIREDKNALSWIPILLKHIRTHELPGYTIRIMTTRGIIIEKDQI